MLHVIGARCVAREFNTIVPWPLERTCWRQFAAQRGDCKKSRTAPLNAIIICSNIGHRLIGVMVRRPPAERQIWVRFSFYLWIFCSRSSHTSDLNIDTAVATPPGAWHDRVNTETGWPGASVFWLDDTECLICNFYLSVAARTIVWADPSRRYTRLLVEGYAIKHIQQLLSTRLTSPPLTRQLSEDSR